MGKGRPAQPPARVPVFEKNRSHGATPAQGCGVFLRAAGSKGLVEIRGRVAERVLVISVGEGLEQDGSILGRGACGEGGIKTQLPGDETSMSGMWGKLQLTQAGLGPRKPGSPRGQMERGSCKLRVGSLQLGYWRPECLGPH